MLSILLLSLLVIVVSFFSSFLEAVFMSISPAFVQVAVREGKRYGILLEHQKENVDRPISAILTLNTIMNVLGAAGVGSMTQKLYDARDPKAGAG